MEILSVFLVAAVRSPSIYYVNPSADVSLTIESTSWKASSFISSQAADTFEGPEYAEIGKLQMQPNTM